MNKDSKITLTYFNARGRVEVVRYLLTYAKKEYKDVRIEKADWPAAKATMPLGQMPVLELTNKDGKTFKMTQSHSILRTVATILGYAGKTPEESARADELEECMRDVQDAYGKILFEMDEKKKAEMLTAFKSDLMPRVFGYLEKNAKAAGGKNLCGGAGYTYADFFLAMLIDTLKRVPAFEAEKLKPGHPTLGAIVSSINESPDIKAYLAARKETDF